ncbi:MAG: RagB/SusD family nutrient uptake outer membrane protein [Bacteroidales bacterium]|nr:MAG: RagB/SusD family nutrient uptake outer membrane protein [Bacteroidales bacterium]
MKKSSNIKQWSLQLFVVVFSILLFMRCSEDFLDPKPLSFFAPENTFVDKDGFDALLLTMRKQIRHEFTTDVSSSDQAAIIYEFMASDIAITGSSQTINPHDFTTQVLPTGTAGKLHWYWKNWYNGIKYANTIISRIDDAAFDNDEERNAILGEAYFFRAYFYYRLTHQFGDVPFINGEVTEPKLNFNTATREAILVKVKSDMEFATQWLPVNVDPGKINRAAGNHLLTKICLAISDFDGAIAASSKVIDNSAYSLMNTRFGSDAGKPELNVMWDLHRRENKSIASNTEKILVVQDKYGLEGNADNSSRPGTGWMRTAVPLVWWLRAPNGQYGISQVGPIVNDIGRGISWIRTSNYYNYEIWKDNNDYRHADCNWFSWDDLYYDNPSHSEESWYLQPIPYEKIAQISNNSPIDSIRTWFPFPYNKVNIPDDNREFKKEGGNSDWYVFRLAETYLLRAEAYYWKGELNNAAADINKVRTRANAAAIDPSEVSIEYILDERARELYLEEPRKCELTRIAFIMADKGLRGYSRESMSTNNFYYDRVIDKNIFYRDQIVYGSLPYRIEAYHYLWPIPQSSIESNTQGHINQNLGYFGSENNVAPITSIEE